MKQIDGQVHPELEKLLRQLLGLKMASEKSFQIKININYLRGPPFKGSSGILLGTIHK